MVKAKAKKVNHKPSAATTCDTGHSAETEKPLRLEWRDPAELRANPSNWRTHPPAQVDALKAGIAECGWAGALLYNERTGNLIDGHARQELFGGQGPVPVLVGSWDEATEKKILATLDPLAAMAEANAGQLDALLREVQTGDEALAAMLEGLAQDAGVLDGVGESTMPDLPDGDKSPFQQMTFTVHDSQAEIIKEALAAAKDAGEFVDSPNENSNGNALARIAEAYLG